MKGSTAEPTARYRNDKQCFRPTEITKNSRRVRDDSRNIKSQHCDRDNLVAVVYFIIIILIINIILISTRVRLGESAKEHYTAFRNSFHCICLELVS